MSMSIVISLVSRILSIFKLIASYTALLFKWAHNLCAAPLGRRKHEGRHAIKYGGGGNLLDRQSRDQAAVEQ